MNFIPVNLDIKTSAALNESVANDMEATDPDPDDIQKILEAIDEPFRTDAPPENPGN